METLLFYLIFGSVAAMGAVAAVFPNEVLAVRQRLGFSNGLWSGGWFYATANRTRLMGVLLGVIGCVAVLSRFVAA
jgi:hypothetical protein